MAVKHSFVNPKADGGDATVTRPSDWNANHVIDNSTITYAMIQNVSATSRLLGRVTAGAGVIEELTATQAKTILAIASGDVSGLAAVATSGSASDLGAGTLPIARVANSAVTYAKIQNVSVTDVVLGRQTAGAGVVEEIACTAAGRAILAAVDAPAQVAILGLSGASTGATIALAAGFAMP